MDISADLTELGRNPVAVISSGCKSFLDIPRTLEYLETQGVGVGTFADGREGKVEFPAFWTRDSGIPSPTVIQDEKEAAAIICKFVLVLSVTCCNVLTRAKTPNRCLAFCQGCSLQTRSQFSIPFRMPNWSQSWLKPSLMRKTRAQVEATIPHSSSQGSRSLQEGKPSRQTALGRGKRHSRD